VAGVSTVLGLQEIPEFQNSRIQHNEALPFSVWVAAAFEKVFSNIAKQQMKMAGLQGRPGNNGNRTGNPGNNGNRTGNTGNKGNTKKGIAKKRAGARSGVKRSSKVALVVKKRWLDKILAGEKDCEIRSSNTSRRGWIHFAESKAGGKLMGRARLVDCFELSKAEFAKGRSHHCVLRLSVVPYKRMFAWVLENAERFEKPFVYEHEQGAVVWVRV
jgi:hypothetical protein